MHKCNNIKILLSTFQLLLTSYELIQHSIFIYSKN